MNNSVQIIDGSTSLTINSCGFVLSLALSEVEGLSLLKLNQKKKSLKFLPFVCREIFL